MSINKTDLDNHIAGHNEEDARMEVGGVDMGDWIDRLLNAVQIRDDRIEALEKRVATLERASYRMATDMNGGA